MNRNTRLGLESLESREVPASLTVKLAPPAITAVVSQPAPTIMATPTLAPVAQSSLAKSIIITTPKFLGPIVQKYEQLGGAKGYLGAAVGTEQKAADGVGSYQTYRNGAIYWSPATGAHAVSGAIRDKWLRLGAERFGYPATDEDLLNTGGQSRFMDFRNLKGQVASIVTHPNLGTYTIYGAIRDRWVSLGRSSGLWATPRTDEYLLADKVGREQLFQYREASELKASFSTIVWHPKTGAHELRGSMADRWSLLGAERYGYPTTDLLSVTVGASTVNYMNFKQIGFENDPYERTIVESNVGTYEVHGLIRLKWLEMGGIRAGVPTSDELSLGGINANRFVNLRTLQKFHIYVSGKKGPNVVYY